MLYVAWCFFFKQKTAYEMRISDWSSDVCSSDLIGQHLKALAECVRGFDVGTIDHARQRIAHQSHAHAIEILDDQQSLAGGERIEQLRVFGREQLLTQHHRIIVATGVRDRKSTRLNSSH